MNLFASLPPILNFPSESRFYLSSSSLCPRWKWTPWQQNEREANVYYDIIFVLLSREKFLLIITHKKRKKRNKSTHSRTPNGENENLFEIKLKFKSLTFGMKIFYVRNLKCVSYAKKYFSALKKSREVQKNVSLNSRTSSIFLEREKIFFNCSTLNNSKFQMPLFTVIAF